MNTEKITTLQAGERFHFKGYDWICLDPDREGGVFAMMAELWCTMPFSERGNNDYRRSDIRSALRDVLLPELGAANLLGHTVNLIADNGETDYGTVTDKVFLLTCDEYRKYRKYVPLFNEWQWTATPRCCTSPNAGDTDGVRGVIAAGQLRDDGASGAGGVAAACILNPESLNLRRQAQVEEA